MITMTIKTYDIGQATCYTGDTSHQPLLCLGIHHQLHTCIVIPWLCYLSFLPSTGSLRCTYIIFIHAYIHNVCVCVYIYNMMVPKMQFFPTKIEMQKSPCVSCKSITFFFFFFFACITCIAVYTEHTMLLITSLIMYNIRGKNGTNPVYYWMKLCTKMYLKFYPDAPHIFLWI